MPWMVNVYFVGSIVGVVSFVRRDALPTGERVRLLQAAHSARTPEDPGVVVVVDGATAEEARAMNDELGPVFIVIGNLALLVPTLACFWHASRGGPRRGPAIWLGLLLIIAAGIARGDAAGSIALTSAALATALQFGYLAGTFTRFTIAGSRATRLRWSRPAVNRPPA